MISCLEWDVIARRNTVAFITIFINLPSNGDVRNLLSSSVHALYTDRVLD
jgi:hypothetical protein